MAAGIIAGPVACHASNYSINTFSLPTNGGAGTPVNEFINATGAVAGTYDGPENSFTRSVTFIGFAENNGTVAFLNPPSTDGGDPTTAFVTGIASSGLVTGYNEDSYGSYSGAFLYNHGTSTSLDIPDSLMTVPTGISASGIVSGFYLDGNSNVHAFTWNNGNTSSFDLISGENGNLLVNDSGHIAGTVDTSSGAAIFEGTPGQLATYPASVNATENVVGINNSGEIIGNLDSPGGIGTGLLIENGVQSNLTYPGAASTLVHGINSSGQIVGSYYLNSSLSGFVYSNGEFSAYNVPGALYTDLWGINDSGQLAGEYVDPNLGWTGFVATPTAAPEPTSGLLLASGMLALTAARRRRATR